ncbi:MAG: hypothetical protein ACYC77_04550 [Coriobacteriia bacterium]
MKRTALIAVAMVALVFGLVAYAGAANTGAVTVTANVNPQMEITVPGAASLSNVDPYTPGTGSVTVTGKSNKASTLTAVVNAGSFTTLDSVAEAGVAFGKGGSLSYADALTGTVDWTVDGDTTVSGSVTYTITQP